MTLDLFIVRQPGDEHYAKALWSRALADRRIRFRPAIPHEQVLRTLRDYDLLAVPSQVAETGPLVVLEAFAAGIPVLASNVGGISERVVDGQNGLLVPRSDAGAWARALQRLVEDPDLLGRLSRGVSPPPTMQSVSERMAALYLRLASPASREPVMPPAPERAMQAAPELAVACAGS
jgi:glycosyltransferase involved in cell wall biosynthesis